MFFNLFTLPGGEKEKVWGWAGLCSRGHCPGNSSWSGLWSEDQELWDGGTQTSADHQEEEEERRAGGHEGREVLGEEREEQRGHPSIQGGQEAEGEPDSSEGRLPREREQGLEAGINVRKGRLRQILKCIFCCRNLTLQTLKRASWRLKSTFWSENSRDMSPLSEVEEKTDYRTGPSVAGSIMALM